MGDSAPLPPPPTYESPSIRRKRMQRESKQATRRDRVGDEEGIHPPHVGEVVEDPIKVRVGINPDRKIPVIRKPPTTFDPGRRIDRVYSRRMASVPGKEGKAGAGRGRRRGTGDEIPAWRTRPVEQFGLLTEPSDGGGEQGGSGEDPARPKPAGGVSRVPLLRWKEVPRRDQFDETNGNWDDGAGEEQEPGFRQGEEAQLGGMVDMEDDVFLEFEEEEETEAEPSSPTTWQLLARYMANFKPSAKSMFDYFSEEAWHLRTGLTYSEKGKNYYLITLYSKGDFDFVARGGPWIFNKNALLVKKLDNAARPSETILDSVPIWVRMYDIPWGKQD